jgi:hypothetical protein
MTDLIEFLRARLDDIEQTARAALRDPQYLVDDHATVDDGVWRAGSHPHDECAVDGVGIRIYDEGGHTAEQARHIALHDPARELAEVDAKRRILDEVVDEATGLDMSVDGDRRVGPRDTTTEPYLGTVLLRLLALPYADHPDYREEWRP